MEFDRKGRRDSRKGREGIVDMNESQDNYFNT